MFYSTHSLAAIMARRIFRTYGMIDAPTREAGVNAMRRLMEGQRATKTSIRVNS